MPVALIAAGVGAVGAIGGAAIAAGGAKSAANTAAQTADKNNALAQQTRDQNVAMMQPTVDRGNAAGTTYNALLGLGGDTGAAQNAFNVFQNSDGYQFRMNEGTKALNTNYAAHGLVQSGAAMKGINAFAQGQASDEFGKYLGQLNNQQSLGVSSQNALAGQNTNYLNAVTNNNNSAGTAAANASLASANAWTGALNGVGNAFGTYAGTQSSYGAGTKVPANNNNAFAYGGIYGPNGTPPYAGSGLNQRYA